MTVVGFSSSKLAKINLLIKVLDIYAKYSDIKRIPRVNQNEFRVINFCAKEKKFLLVSSLYVK